MTPEQYQRLKQVYGAARECASGERTAVVTRLCDGDDTLRAEVESLLAQEATWPGFLESPALGEGAAASVASGVFDPPEELLVGRTVGRFSVEGVIATGGMGTVYRALQDSPSRTVALKVLRPGLLSAAAARRFGQEAQVLARLQHPGIAQVFEAGTHAGDGTRVLYIAMELIDGARAITQYANDQKLALRERLALFARACEAVHHGHLKGVIHRDLKPANILVDQGGNPKVIDFGVARATDADIAVATMQTTTGQLVGTLAYMSPEQCGGDPREVDTRCDVYSLGVVLYELLCGQAPLDVKSRPIAEAIRAVQEESPRRPSALVPALRGDPETIILKAMAKDRAQRYQSVAQLAGDIGRFLDSQPIEARPPSVMYNLRLLARRNRALMAGALVGAAALVGATAVSAVFAVRAGERAKEAEAARARAEKASEFLEGALSAANPFIPGGIDTALLASDIAPWAEWRMSPWDYAGEPGLKARVSDVLAAAGERLETSFAEDPQTHARLAGRMGWTLFRLNAIPQAEKLLRESMNLRKQTPGVDHPETIQAMLRYAEFSDRWVSPTESERIYREAHAASVRVHGALSAWTFQVEQRLAHNLIEYQSRRAEAEALMRTSVEAAMKARPHDPDVLLQRAYFAEVLARVGKSDEAASIGAESVASLRALLGDSDLRTAMAIDWYANAVCYGKHAAEAIEPAKMSIALQERLFGHGSMQVAIAYRHLAQALDTAGRAEEGREAWRTAARIYDRLLGPDDFETLRAQGQVVRSLLRDKTGLEEAERTARVVYAGLKGLSDEDPADSYEIGYGATLVEALLVNERVDEAMAVFEEVRTNAWRSPNPEYVGWFQHRCFDVLGGTSERARIEPALLDDLRRAEEHGTTMAGVAAQTRRLLVLLYTELGEQEKAAGFAPKP